jgi:hypothetical protein
MKAVQVQEQSTELDDLWIDYVRLVRQIPAECSPLWIAYYQENNIIHLLAVVPNQKPDAIALLFDAETAINIQLCDQGRDLQLDTMIFEQSDGILPTDHHQIIFRKDS